MVQIQEIVDDVDLSYFPRRRYGTILADPPWPTGMWQEGFSNKETHPNAMRGGTIEAAIDRIKEKPGSSFYTTMSMSAICSLPVSRILKDDALVFIWVIETHLRDAFDLIDSWGLKYVCVAFIWGKVSVSDASRPAPGMGYWTRKCGEICLMAKRGKPKRINKSVTQLVLEPRRGHSRKPDAVPDVIRTMSSGPYLELFAREKREGWDAWGNETEKFK